MRKLKNIKKKIKNKFIEFISILLVLFTNNTTESLAQCVMNKEIFFFKNSTKPDSISQIRLLELINVIQGVIKKDTSLIILIEGHSSSDENNPYILSKYRVDSITTCFLKKGVGISNIKKKYYGSKTPKIKYKKCSEKQQQNNRRIEFILIRKTHGYP